MMVFNPTPIPGRALEWWLEHVWNPKDWLKLNEEQYLYYESKYRIAADIKPASIVEIGVRYGYSAAAFLLACPQAKYMGFDVIS